MNNDEAARQGRPARYSTSDVGNRSSRAGQIGARRYPHTTGLQAWSLALLAQLDAARDQLHADEYEVLLDCLAVAVARATVRQLLAEPETEAAAA